MLNLQDWLDEIAWRERRMRAATPVYERFDRAARRLTIEAIRSSDDEDAIADLEAVLRQARHVSSARLSRVWSRAELGELIVEATNRRRQIYMGRVARRVKGPRLDPARLPDDRLEALIQRHQDLELVDRLRAERERRAAL